MKSFCDTYTQQQQQQKRRRRRTKNPTDQTTYIFINNNYYFYRCVLWNANDDNYVEWHTKKKIGNFIIRSNPTTNKNVERTLRRKKTLLCMLIINIGLCLDIDTYTLCAIGNRSNESDHTLYDMWWEIKIWRAIDRRTLTAIVREKSSNLSTPNKYQQTQKFQFNVYISLTELILFFFFSFVHWNYCFPRLCKRMWVYFNWCSWRRRQRRQRQSTKIDSVNDGKKKHKTKRFIQSANGMMNCANIQ